jgi:hypothetical protein
MSGNNARVNRIVLYDPIEEMVYSRSVRKGSAGYKEHGQLQDILLEEGVEELRRVVRRHFAGLVEAHLTRD